MRNYLKCKKQNESLNEKTKMKNCNNKKKRIKVSRAFQQQKKSRN